VKFYKVKGTESRVLEQYNENSSLYYAEGGPTGTETQSVYVSITPTKYNYLRIFSQRTINCNHSHFFYLNIAIFV